MRITIPAKDPAALAHCINSRGYCIFGNTEDLVWIRNQLDVTLCYPLFSSLQVVQHVSGNYVPIFRS